MNWYVIFTKPRQENRAFENLQRQGFECFMPMIAIERIRGGAKCVVMEPMFARYLFIHLDDSIYGKSWIPIRSTRGVCRMVAFGGQPAKIGDDIISIFARRSEMSRGEVEKLFYPGEEVRLIGDLWTDVHAIYEADNGEQRAMVLIELLGRLVRLSVSAGQLSKV